MLRYAFESGLTIHEIKALYGAVDLDDYLEDPAETAMGLANSTMLTVRDDDQLVGLVRGLSDMHTIAFVQDLIVLPDYQHQGLGHELLKQFVDYFKQIPRVIVVCQNPELKDFFADAGFVAGAKTESKMFIHPRRLLQPRF